MELNEIKAHLIAARDASPSCSEQARYLGHAVAALDMTIREVERGRGAVGEAVQGNTPKRKRGRPRKVDQVQPVEPVQQVQDKPEPQEVSDGPSVQ